MHTNEKKTFFLIMNVEGGVFPSCLTAKFFSLLLCSTMHEINLTTTLYSLCSQHMKTRNYDMT